MEKYKSYHFSLLNRRSLLSPQQENGYKRGERKTFAPLSEEQIDHQNPYQWAHEEIEEKIYEAGGIVKKAYSFCTRKLGV